MDANFGSSLAKMPVLETDRLIMRKMTVRDADDMFEYSCRPEVPQFLLWSPHESVNTTRRYLKYLQTQYAQKKFFDWALDLKSTGKMSGTCGFSHIDDETTPPRSDTC